MNAERRPEGGGPDDAWRNFLSRGRNPVGGRSRPWRGKAAAGAKAQVERRDRRVRQ